MNKKLEQRLEAMCAECMSIWENMEIDVSIRSRALRFYADIYEDLSILDYDKASKGYMASVIAEYDRELTKLYGEF